MRHNALQEAIGRSRSKIENPNSLIPYEPPPPDKMPIRCGGFPRLFRLPPPCCQWYGSRRVTFSGLTHCHAIHILRDLSSPSTQVRRQHTAIDNLPRVAQPSLWKSLIPSFLRKSHQPPRTLGSKRPNPATFFIIIFTLIGSQAIQFIKLRHDTATRSRHAEKKIALLKEVIRKGSRRRKR